MALWFRNAQASSTANGNNGGRAARRVRAFGGVATYPILESGAIPINPTTTVAISA